MGGQGVPLGGSSRAQKRKWREGVIVLVCLSLMYPAQGAQPSFLPSTSVWLATKTTSNDAPLAAAGGSRPSSRFDSRPSSRAEDRPAAAAAAGTAAAARGLNGHGAALSAVRESEGSETQVGTCGVPGAGWCVHLPALGSH